MIIFYLATLYFEAKLGFLRGFKIFTFENRSDQNQNISRDPLLTLLSLTSPILYKSNANMDCEKGKRNIKTLVCVCQGPGRSSRVQRPPAQCATVQARCALATEKWSLWLQGQSRNSQRANLGRALLALWAAGQGQSLIFAHASATLGAAVHPLTRTSLI